MVKIMVSNRKKNKSLIMCTTPLQMIIAKRIIENNCDKCFDLVVIALSNNNKYKHYYNELKELCENSFYYVPRKGITGFLYFVKKMRLENISRDYMYLYLASIDSRYFHYIISKNHIADIFTFDDGLANIISSDIYYSSEIPVLWKKIIWRLMGVKYYIKDIREKSLLHYTIYKDVNNIIENTRFIDLFKDEVTVSNTENHEIKIYLGQPLNELTDTIHDTDIINILKNLDIGFYYPHPREKNVPDGDFQVIENDLVFEDYVINFLKNNPKVSIKVYSFISSTMLNIASFDRIEVNYIYNFDLYNKFKDFYDFVLNDFDIFLLEV